MSQSVSRRRFLEVGAGTSLAAYAAVAAANPSSSANETIVVGVMGVNGRGRALSLGFADRPGVEVAYVCDVDSRATKRAAGAVAEKTSKAPAVVGDFRRILDDPQVDMLAVATPNHWHAPATILACSAGKHVYCEKPCSYSPQEGEWSVQAARQNNRVVTMGTQRRSWQPIIQAMEKLHSGEIGPVRYARCWYANRRPTIGIGKQVEVPEWLDFELWQGPAPRRPYKDNLLHYNWHWHWHWGNGELGNNGVHALDLARWGMGVDYPTRVTSAGGRYRFEDDQETPDTHLATFEFGKRAILWEGLSCFPMGPGGTAFGVTFHGDKGTLELFDAGYRIYDMQRNQIAEFKGPASDTDHFDNFLNCIREGGRPSADIEEGHKSTLLCHLGNIAVRTGHTLNVDPTNGHILDDAQTAGLWNREYEPGWKPTL